jgi:glucose-6-phosphate-specific signal transduction histidine kinase
MYKRLRGEAWLRHVAVAVTYYVAVSLFREISISHWLVFGGLCLSALLLTPYRYWPALLLGEMAYLTHLSYVCADQFGATWAFANLVPSLLFVAPVVYWAREHGGIFTQGRNVRVGPLLLCALLVAAVLSINSLALVMTAILPRGYPALDYPSLSAKWMLGNYLGILTITPLSLLLYQEIHLSSWAVVKRKVVQSRLTLDVACVLLPLLVFLVWIGLNAEPDSQVRKIVQFAMFLPVVWLALRHGWHGAAMGGTGASIAILGLMPHRYDVDTIQAEIMIAFVISTMLLMGARIAVLDRSRRTEREDLRMALALAQRNAQMGEMQLRMTSQTLEQIGLAVHSVCMTMTNRFRLPHSAIEDRSYQHLALTAKDQLFGLADSLYPAGWQEKGISSALREGQIPRILDKAGIKYWCDIRCPLDQFSGTLHLTIYRMACDAIAAHCAKRNVDEIGVKLRCGKRSGRRWVVLKLSFGTDSSARKSVRWDQLLPQILPAGSGRGFDSIEDRAATFEGRARERTLLDKNVISVLLLDPEESVRSSFQ